MPIDYSKYPVSWREISLRIRERDNQCCKWCGIPNKAYYCRGNGDIVVLTADNREEAEMEAPEGARIRRVVLTVAHIDHDIANNSDGNLAALCQICHLRHDAQQHIQNAAHTRRRRKIEAGQREFLL